MNDTYRIYKERILHHGTYPCKSIELQAYDFELTMDHISCGDSVKVQGVISDTVLSDVAIMTRGCTMSRAAGSLIAMTLTGASLETILAYSAQDVQSLLGIQLGPIRLRCALLALDCLQKGLTQLRAHQQGERDAR
ncbi:MAG: iron-sulfur cluster assembly scaffold protein [Candidatus Babeliales bacterium]